MKIFAVGMNYREHCQELHPGMELPSEPVVFMKPDSALLKDSKPFFLPDFSNRIEYETELVVRINRLGKSISERFASRYYDAVTVGIDFTARDLQQELVADGRPWEISKGFDGAAVIGDFIPVDKLPEIQQLEFNLNVDGKTVQRGDTSDMIFHVNKIVSYISRFYTLKMGDLLYTGTPVGVGPVSIGQHLEGFLEEKKVLDFYIR
ncbi:MAG: fumarylacetoacetate hydrolase family protein [Phocaeicola sp.]|uniref:fumarylacetoacetate hydrolase family protein n=1 Tax=Phocaeicola sp. TaxID=2773926 RepID=UPI003F9FA26A